jgi:hypothetical protein
VQFWGDILGYVGWEERGFDILIPFEGAVNVQHRTLTVALAQLIAAHHGVLLPHHLVSLPPTLKNVV